MSTLSFVPRSVKRRKVDGVGKESDSKPSTSSISNRTSTPPLKAGTRKSNVQKGSQDNDLSLNYATLVWLSMSDYSLWVDSDLRRTIAFSDRVESTEVDYKEEYETGEGENDKSVEQGQKVVNGSGYVRLKYLLRHSPIFRLVSSLELYRNVKEAAYANALRRHARQEIDVRFILHSESSSTRASVNTNRGVNLESGFEVRRNDLATSASAESNFSRYCKADWDRLTLYFENIPFKFRNIAGIAGLTMSLLPPCPTITTLQRVQNISFPSRHEGEPESIPTCKGFALVTLSRQDDVKVLLDAWPWGRSSASRLSQDPTENANPGVPMNDNQELTSAKTFGLRICTKAHWEELRAEYLLYRQQLVDEINQQQDADAARRRVLEIESKPCELDSHTAPMKRKRSGSSTARIHHEVIISSPQYPSGCLVFVRHVHPGTNKTTLRTLFSRAWEGNSENKDVIHYIDYGKNMDSCYVRLSTPAHAELFVNYFSNRSVIQLSGLDDVGSDLSSRQDSTTPSKVILPELVLGRREEVYWEKVPEKLRRQAMEKLLKTMNGGEENDQVGNGSGSKKKRKKTED